MPSSCQQMVYTSTPDPMVDDVVLFGLTISQKKTQVMGQATPSPPCITVNGEELGVVHQFQYLGSTTTDTLFLDVELSKRIGKASTTLSKLTKRVWENKHLTILTKITVYKACVIGTLLYGSDRGLHTPHKNREAPGLPSAVPSEDPWNYMTGQGTQRLCPPKSRYPIYVQTSTSKN